MRARDRAHRGRGQQTRHPHAEGGPADGSARAGTAGSVDPSRETGGRRAETTDPALGSAVRARARAHLGRGQQSQRLRLVCLRHREGTCASGEATGAGAPGGGCAHDPRDTPADPNARADCWPRPRRRRGAGGALGMLVAGARGLAGWIGVRAPEGADPTTGSSDPTLRLEPRSGRAAHAAGSEHWLARARASRAGAPG